MPELAGWWTQYVPTPVGMWCISCHTAIGESDQGFVYPYVDADGAALAAIHLGCQLLGPPCPECWHPHNYADEPCVSCGCERAGTGLAP